MKRSLALLVAVLAWLAMTFTLVAAQGEWLTDFDQAQKLAKEQNKLILMDFTGSDWCPPCKLLHKNVFSTREFAEFAAKHLVLVEIDFPQRKRQSEALKKANQALAKKFTIEGYPTVIVLDANGKQLKKEVGYSGLGAADYVAGLKKLL